MKEETDGKDKKAVFPATSSTLFGMMREVRNSPLEDANRAFEKLCERYYGSIHRFFLNRLHDESKANDCTHELLRKDRLRKCVEKWDPTKYDKFRIYLTQACRNHCSDFKRAASKHDVASATYDDEREADESELNVPEDDEQFAIDTFVAAREALEREYQERSKKFHYELISPLLFDPGRTTQEKVGQMFTPALTGSAVSKAVKTMREEFIRIFHSLVADVTRHDLIEDEMRYLKDILAISMRGALSKEG